MKRIFGLMLLLLLTSVAFSQTTVTFQVTDADSQAWANSPYQVFLTSALAAGPSQGANMVQPQLSGTLNATGGASFSLAAATYTFKVTPLAASQSGGVFGNQQTPIYSTSVAVSGGSQTVTLTPPAIRLASLIGVAVKAYADGEITGAVAGSHYFNLILNLDREYNGTIWMDEGDSTPVAFAALPSCAAALEGIRRSVTDSTSAVFNATVVGSGTNHVLAYCNGTNWTVH